MKMMRTMYRCMRHSTKLQLQVPMVAFAATSDKQALEFTRRNRAPGTPGMCSAAGGLRSARLTKSFQFPVTQALTSKTCSIHVLKGPLISSALQAGETFRKVLAHLPCRQSNGNNPTEPSKYIRGGIMEHDFSCSRWSCIRLLRTTEPVDQMRIELLTAGGGAAALEGPAD